ncbi:MAG: ubiquinol-cytochrome c reductase iron-sulfur subunit [Thermomicrobiales bacterium]
MIPLSRTILGLGVTWFIARLLGLLARLHVMPSTRAKRVSRRNFVRNSALGAVVLILTQLGAGFVRFFWPNETGAFGSELRVSASEVPEVNGEPLKHNLGKYWLVHNDDGLLALYWKCPHLGCTVPWNTGRGEFVCPCHGSVYDPTGVRLAGPAPRPMDIMAVRIDEATGDVLVDTGAITQRSGYEPSQAAPYSA